jgi:hypothetical protein
MTYAPECRRFADTGLTSQISMLLPLGAPPARNLTCRELQMKLWLTFFASVGFCTGCTTISLERHTLSQATSAQDLRYQEVLTNLAMIAYDRSLLPAYSSVYSGTAQVTDSGSVVSTTAWQHMKGMTVQNGFASEALNPQLSRMVLQNWTLDPIVVPEKLEAMRAACKWVVYGPESLSPEEMSLLASPDEICVPSLLKVCENEGSCQAGSVLTCPPEEFLTQRHFDVQKRLASCPPNWLGKGKLKDVPLSAAYKAHYRDTWVWVMPGDLYGLATISLVLQDIDRVNSNSLTLFYVPATHSPLVVNVKQDKIMDCNGTPINASVQAVFAVDPCMQLAPDAPYRPWRVDNVTSDPTLRSIINAAGLP